jgi:hypothetical protein
MDENMIFNYAIFSHFNSKNEASQMAGRVKGNIKLYKNYKKPVVFTTDLFNEIAIEWEEKSRNLAVLAFEKEKEGILTIVTKNEFNTCNENFDYIIHDKLFDRFSDCKIFLNRIDIRNAMRVKKVIITHDEEKGPIHRIGRTPDNKGYAVTSKLINKEHPTVHNLTKEMRLTIVDANKIPASRCISSTGQGSKYLILPVYDSLDTPPDKEKYQVRYISYHS